MIEGAPNTCFFCQKATSLYKCPRCDLFYCGVECYRSDAHSACSEEFYRQQCLSEMADTKADDELRKRTLEILSRHKEAIERQDLHEDYSTDTEESSEEQRDISPETLADLEKRINNGTVGQCFSPCLYRPWWWSDGDVTDEIKSVLANQPTIPTLASLTKRKVHHSVRYQLFALLGAYCALWRKYDGELRYDPGRVVKDLCQMYQDGISNANGCLRYILDAHGTLGFYVDQTEKLVAIIRKDLCEMLSPSQDCTLLKASIALIDLTVTLKEAKSSSPESGVNPFSRRVVKIPNVEERPIRKKIRFLLSWLQEQTSSQLDAWRDEVADWQYKRPEPLIHLCSDATTTFS